MIIKLEVNIFIEILIDLKPAQMNFVPHGIDIKYMHA